MRVLQFIVILSLNTSILVLTACGVQPNASVMSTGAGIETQENSLSTAAKKWRSFLFSQRTSTTVQEIYSQYDLGEGQVYTEYYDITTTNVCSWIGSGRMPSTGDLIRLGGGMSFVVESAATKKGFLNLAVRMTQGQVKLQRRHVKGYSTSYTNDTVLNVGDRFEAQFKLIDCAHPITYTEDMFSSSDDATYQSLNRPLDLIKIRTSKLDPIVTLHVNTGSTPGGQNVVDAVASEGRTCVSGRSECDVYLGNTVGTDGLQILK